MVKLYMLGAKEETTLEFSSVEKAEKFLTNIYDHVFNPVECNDGIIYRCKTTAISQYKLCDWVLENYIEVHDDK